MHIGEEIKRLREEKGLTQTKLAKGFSTASYISQIERGTVIPSRKVLHAIAARLERPTYHFEALAAQTGNRELLTKLERLQSFAEISDFSKADKLVTELLEEESHLWDPNILGRWHFCRGFLAWRKRELDDALFYFRQALQSFENCGNQTEAAKSLSWLGWVHRARNDLDLSVKYLRKAVGILAETRQDKTLFYSLRLSLALSLYCQGQLDEARQIYESLDKEAGAYADYGQRVSLLLGLSLTYENSGQVQLAFEYATKARLLAEEHSDMLMVATSERTMADGLLRNGEYDQALVYLDRALVKQKQSGTVFEQSRLLLKKARVHALNSDMQNCEHLLLNVLDLHCSTDAENLLIKAESSAVRGLAHKSMGNLKQAIDNFKCAGIAFSEAGYYAPAGDNLQLAAELLFETGEKDQAIEIMRRIIEIFKRTSTHNEAEWR